MPNSAPGFASRPDYRVDLLPAGRRVTVKFGGVTIADSSEALQVEETGHGPVYYLPEKDVRLDLMRPTEHHTRCPYKGEASYWTIEVPAEAGSVRRWAGRRGTACVWFNEDGSVAGVAWREPERPAGPLARLRAWLGW